MSVDTVYTSVGRKPELLLAVHDMALGGGDEPVGADQRDYVAAIRAARGARAKLETYAAALAVRLPSAVPLAESLRVAADLTPSAGWCSRGSTSAARRTCSASPPSCARRGRSAAT